MVAPSGITSTGWPAVRDTAAGFGVSFDFWQDGAGRLILAKREDGSYACSVGGAVLSIPRQVGKTFLIGAIVFALCLLHPNLVVLWTAHHQRTANETFSKMQAFSRRVKVRAHIAKIVLGNGDQEIQFHNGSRILFGARARGFGRGFDNVDVEVFDEAQILTESTLDDMIPAMNAAPNPLPIFIGTPPKPSDPSEFFTNKRKAVLEEGDEDSAYVEFSADEGCDLDDRDQWAKANPSYPTRTKSTAIKRMRKLLGDDSFAREGLGIWPGSGSDALPWNVVTEAQWEACRSTEPAELATTEGWWEGPPVLAIERSASHTAIVGAGACREGGTGVQLVEHKEGVEWVLDLMAAIRAERKCSTVVIDKVALAASLIDDLEDEGWTVLQPKYAELKQATTDWHDGIVTPGWIHRPPAEGPDTLTEHVGRVSFRTSSEGVQLLDRKGGDFTAAVASVLALWGAGQAPGPPPTLIF